MTRPCRCSIPVEAAPRRDGCGSTPASKERGAGRSRRPRFMCMRRIAKLNVPLRISNTSGAFFMSTAMPGFEPLSQKGDVVVAACLSHTRRKFYDVVQATNARSRSRRCAASANFMPSKRRARSVACTTACGASLSLQANRRRFARLARVAASVAVGTKHARRGDPLRVGALAWSDPLPARRPHRVGHEPRRTRDSTRFCHRHQNRRLLTK